MTGRRWGGHRERKIFADPTSLCVCVVMSVACCIVSKGWLCWLETIFSQSLDFLAESGPHLGLVCLMASGTYLLVLTS